MYPARRADWRGCVAVDDRSHPGKPQPAWSILNLPWSCVSERRPWRSVTSLADCVTLRSLPPPLSIEPRPIAGRVKGDAVGTVRPVIFIGRPQCAAVVAPDRRAALQRKRDVELRPRVGPLRAVAIVVMLGFRGFLFIRQRISVS